MRKRRKVALIKDRLVAIENEAEYKRNIGSVKAKRIKIGLPSVVFDLWVDKHYCDRSLFGDENGSRSGIEPKVVEELVTESLKYLVTYGSLLESFSFLNNGLSGERFKRIVLQRENETGKLSVVIEIHLVNESTFEVTVKTAMKVDDFRIGDGQYIIAIIDDKSILRKMRDGRMVNVCNCNSL